MTTTDPSAEVRRLDAAILDTEAQIHWHQRTKPINRDAITGLRAEHYQLTRERERWIRRAWKQAEKEQAAT